MTCVVLGLLLGEYPSFVDKSYLDLKDKLDKQPSGEILDELDNHVVQDYRYNSSVKFQRQIQNQKVLSEEKILSRLSLRQLYEITVHNNVDGDQANTLYSDYTKLRARELIDLSIAYLQKQLND